MNKCFGNILAYNSFMFNEIFGNNRKVPTLSEIDTNDFIDLTKQEFCVKYDVSGIEYEVLFCEFQGEKL